MTDGTFDASFSGSVRTRVPVSGLGFLVDQYSLWGCRPVIKLNSLYAIEILVVLWDLRDDKDCPFLLWLGVGAFYYILDVFPLAQEELATEGVLWSDS